MKTFDRLAALITNNSRYVIGVFVVLSVVVASGAPSVEQSTSMESFQPDNAEADALDRIEANYSGEENTSVAQVIVQNDDVLDRATLLAMLRYERALLANETVNETLVDEEPIVGVHDLVATAAIRGEKAENLSAALEEFRRLNESVQQEQAALQRNRTALQQRRDALNATSERLRSELTFLRKNPDADVDAAFDRVRNASNVSLDAEDRETFRQAASALRQAESEAEVERAYRRGTRGVLEEEYTALQERRDQLEQRREQLEADVERLQEFGEEVEDRQKELEAVDDPSLERKIDQLRSMNDSEIDAVVERVLSEDGPRSGRALLFMPRDYELGTADANATVLLVTHQAESSTSPASSPQRIIDAQTTMRTIGVDQSADASYTVFGDGILADEIDTSMQDSILLVAPMALLFVLVVLTIAYRDILDVTLGLAGVGLVLAWTFGFMGWLGIDFGQVFIMVPVLLIGLSIDFGIHVFMRYREERSDEDPRQGVRDAMRAALSGLGIALAFVTTTTAVGFLSNLASPAPPIRKIGLVSAWGIVAALLVFGLFIPAVKQELDTWLKSRGVDRYRAAFGTGDGSLSRLLEVGSWGAQRAPVAVIAGALLISAAGAYGATGIDSSFENSDFLAEGPADWIEELPEPFAPAEYTARDTIDLLNDRFVRQDQQVQILVEGDVTSDGTLEQVDAGQDAAANSSAVATGAGGDAAITSPLTVMRDVAATNESFNATFTGADTDGDGVPDRNLEEVYDDMRTRHSSHGCKGPRYQRYASSSTPVRFAAKTLIRSSSNPPVLMMSSVLTAASRAGTALYTVPVLGIELGKPAFTVIGICLILLLLMGSGFFSSSEIAMFSLPAHQIDAMVEEGLRGARAVKSLKEDPHRLLVTILVGNNLVNITMSSISTTIVGFYFDPGTAVLVSSFGITSMVLVFGESAPKSYAVEHTELHARRVARGLKIVEKILWPLITLFYYLTSLVNKITGGTSAIEETYVTREEIRNMIKTGEREDILDEDEREILQRALRFTDTTAKEVMTPRLDMAAIPSDTTVEDAIRECIRSGHARLPVYEGSLDSVSGVFDVRELDEVNYDTFGDLDVADVVTPTLHVPESKNVDDLLSEMRDNRMHMVIVVDEFGATEGLITMEDIVEEIVGEILVGDEDHPIELLDDTEGVVRGEVNIEEVNEALDIDLPEGEEFETIAGLMFNLAGRLVQQGEAFDYEHVTLRAEQVDDTRIQKVRVTVNPDAADPVEAEPKPGGGDPD